MTLSIFLEKILDTPVGPLALAASMDGLIAVEIGVEDLDEWRDQKSFPAGGVRFEPGPFPVISWFRAYFDGDRRSFDIPLDLHAASDFQRGVLRAVLSVPYGETRTYAQIAERIGRPTAYRAVGRANATNPLPIVVPCHRLVGSDGSLRGYGAPGGIETKAWLLRFEAGLASPAGQVWEV